MDDITIISGEAFVSLAAMIETAEVKGLPVRMCQDEGGIKVKIGNYTWSPALGERDPECMAAAPALREPVAQSVDMRPALWGGDPGCTHEIEDGPGGGIRCKNCGAWHCA